MMRKQLTNYELLKQMLETVSSDDLSLPWDTYPCLLWPRGKNNSGYGKVWFDGKFHGVHVVAYERRFGPVDSYGVLHKCDVRSCFRVSHLFTGTDLDNARDCNNKGRRNWQIGSKHGMAKLSDHQVLEIRKLRAEGWTLVALGARFRVHFSMIGNIARRNNWKHI